MKRYLSIIIVSLALTLWGVCQLKGRTRGRLNGRES